jgi:ribonuclease P protein component
LDTVRANSFGWDSKLRETDDFSSVFRLKRVLRGTHLDIFFRHNGGQLPRLGLVVPKKVLARAVDRNRLRRILREAFRLSQAELGGLDVVIRLKSAGQDDEYRAQWGKFVSRLAAGSPAAPDRQING